MKPYAEAKAEWLRGYLEQCLFLAEHNVTKAARLAGIHRGTFYELAKSVDLKPQGQGRDRYGNKGNAAWRALA